MEELELFVWEKLGWDEKYLEKVAIEKKRFFETILVFNIVIFSV